MTIQIENMESFLAWLKTCTVPNVISSMSGNYIHVKFLIDPAGVHSIKSEDTDEN